MEKVFAPAATFTLKLASKPKRESNLKSNNISRICLAVVKEIDGEFKAVINLDKKYIRLKEGDELSNEQLVLPFTEKSLDLRDKTYVWLKKKDKYGHNVCIIRDSISAHLHPGIPEQYDVFKENCLLSGHIVRKDGKMYFNYEDLVATNYQIASYIIEINIDDTKPLFNK